MILPTYVIVIAIIKCKEKYLIGKRAAHKQFAPNEWELISGFIDSKESAEDIILREIKEETQLSGKILKEGLPFTIADEEARWIVVPFRVVVSSNKAMVNVKDHSELMWVTKRELTEYTDLRIYLTELVKQGLL